MKVLLLNGPPRCGKDTIGRMLQAQIPGSKVFKFADELKCMTHRAFGHGGPADMFEDIKDDPNCGPAPGMTWRQAYIAMSEKFVKPLLGVAYLGRVLARKIEQVNHRLAIVADSGFREEAEALRDAGHDLARLLIWRPGCSFDGDSRSYWLGEGVVPYHLDWSLRNSGTLEDLDHTLDPAFNWIESWREAA